MSFLNGTDPGLRQTKVPVVDTYTAGSGFTAGSTTALTLSADPGNETACEVSFDGILQHGSTFTHSGTTLTFSSAIPTGVTEVQVRHAAAIPATTPADASVTQAKLGNEAVNEAKLQVSNSPTNGYMLTAQSGNTGGLTWAEAASGGLVQTVSVINSAVATTTAALPVDDTIPQIGEGAEAMTLAITPTSASNKLVIHVKAHVCTSDTGGAAVAAALFQDSTANALGVSCKESNGSNENNSIQFTHVMTAGTTSATTFSVRYGYAVAVGTATFNGQGGSRRFGGVYSSSIVIQEVT